jgi:hypothetical protein
MRAARFTRIDQQKMSRAVKIGDFHLIDRDPFATDGVLRG